MKINFRPLGDKILVKPLAEEEKTKAGIIIPDSAQEKPFEGEVLAVGSGRIIDGKLVPLDVKVGDKVIYKKYGAEEIKIEGEELLIIEINDVLGIIN